MSISKKIMILLLSIAVTVVMTMSFTEMAYADETASTTGSTQETTSETVKTTTATAAPENISYIKTTSRTDQSVSLKWKDISSADKYKAMVMSKSGKVIKTKTVTANKTKVSGLKQKTKYKFKVVATSNSVKTSSKVITVTTKAKFIRPVKGRVLSKFGHRSGYGSSYHLGVDLKASTGTKVRAAASGKVIMVGWYFGYGKCIKIRHANGYVTLYGHLSKYCVRKGQHVRQGQVIGRAGHTGQASCSHVHFEIIKSGKHKNPLRYL
jgi:murein DD-endopeptidase MepM/ murein hydrolase activator NlpD